MVTVLEALSAVVGGVAVLMEMKWLMELSKTHIGTNKFV